LAAASLRRPPLGQPTCSQVRGRQQALIGRRGLATNYIGDTRRPNWHQPVRMRRLRALESQLKPKSNPNPRPHLHPHPHPHPRLSPSASASPSPRPESLWSIGWRAKGAAYKL